MQNFFIEMAAFERWANGQILDWLEAHPGQPEMTRIFAHLVADHLPWLHLLVGEEVPADFAPEPDWTLAECRTRLAEAMDTLHAFVRSLDETDLSSVVRSSAPNGVTFENTVAEILLGIFNHAEHHRGQLIFLIGRETGEYVPSVYFSYLRQAAKDAQPVLSPG